MRIDGCVFIVTGASPGNTPEFVAELIITAIEEGAAQHFANDRLRQLAGA